MKKDEKEELGIEGMLRRLGRVRTSSRRGSSREKEVNCRTWLRIGADGEGNTGELLARFVIILWFLLFVFKY